VSRSSQTISTLTRENIPNRGSIPENIPNRGSIPENVQSWKEGTPSNVLNGYQSLPFDKEVEKKIKDRIGQQTMEDFDFLEDLTRLISQQEEEKTKQLAQIQFKQQQQMRPKKK